MRDDYAASHVFSVLLVRYTFEAGCRFSGPPAVFDQRLDKGLLPLPIGPVDLELLRGKLVFTLQSSVVGP